MKINFLSELCHTFPRLTVIVSEGLHRQKVFFMKRWRYLCAAALIAGSMAAGAGAVSIPSTALTQLQQQWQADTSADYLSADSGQSRIAAYALVPKKICTKFLPTRYENQASSFYYADASGTVTPIQTPVKGTYFGMAGDGCFFIGVYAKRPLTAAVQQPAEQYDIPTLVLLDENMKVIRDDIDGACGAVSTPHFTNGLMPIQTGSTLWIGSRKGAIGNGTYGLIDKTGQFVGKHDFDGLSWADNRYIGKRGTALYQLDGKGGEIQLPANASQESSWAKPELEAAREHDISLSFYYPMLNITRVDFCRLAVKLYQKVQPNASAAPAAAFSDCENESVCLATALGIVTGYDDGTFRPYQSITRQEAAAMLDRLYTSLGGKASAANDKPYADDAQLGDWARSSVYAMREIGIMQGKENNRFRPKDGYTQEQAVVTVERAFQAVKKY